MNIYGWLRENAQQRPDKVCLKYSGGELSFAELDRQTRAFGTSLRAKGVGRGDRVVIVLNNSPEFVISYMGIIGLGAVVVPVNPAYSPRELQHILSDSEAKGLVIEKAKFNNYEKIQDVCPLDVVITAGEGSSFAEWTSGPADEIYTEVDSHDVAAFVYSAGLTGYAMGAMLTHGNLDHNADLMRIVMGCGENDTTLVLIPCFHTFSASVNMLSMLRYGGCMYVMKTADFGELKYALTEGGVTAMGVVPTLCFGFTHHPEMQDVDFSKVHTIISGGAALPMEIYDEFKKRHGVEILQGYGLTEASPVCATNDHKRNRPGSIGPVVPGVEVRVVDGDGNILAPGVEGELMFRGANVMKGYYERPQESADILEDGWLHTGDLGYVDEDGYIFITGYLKEMIIVSGFNVYCREVEEVLQEMDGVVDCAIVGVPDLIRGAIVKAYIVPKDAEVSEKVIRKEARRQLASYKTPREVVFVESIPRDAEGKIMREQLAGLDVQ